ncbi:hypothetical protein CC79DRAFT_1366784 [Sarocladium strictum]
MRLQFVVLSLALAAAALPEPEAKPKGLIPIEDDRETLEANPAGEISAAACHRCPFPCTAYQCCGLWSHCGLTLWDSCVCTIF